MPHTCFAPESAAAARTGCVFLTNKAFYQARPLRFWLRLGSVGVSAPLFICLYQLRAPSHP